MCLGRILILDVDTYILNWLIDVLWVVRSLIGGVGGRVSPYMKKVEYVSLLVQTSLVEVSP